MKFINHTFSIDTSMRCQMRDITAEIRDALAKSGISSGRVTVFCPHTTGAITINENADPDVQHDMLLTLKELFPKNRSGYRHIEGNSDSHIKASLFGASETILVKDNRLVLGTWQGVYFCEFDGPRRRKFMVMVEGI